MTSHLRRPLLLLADPHHAGGGEVHQHGHTQGDGLLVRPGRQQPGGLHLAPSHGVWRGEALPHTRGNDRRMAEHLVRITLSGLTSS